MFWAFCGLLALLSGGCGGKKTPVKAVARPVGWSESGIASWYGDPYHGRRAANGEVYDMEKLTAAHKTLPFNTWVRVKNESNGRTVDMRITDRGPFIRGRIIDLSRAGAREIDMLGAGVTKVKITVIKPPSREPVPIAVSKPEPPPATQTGERFGVQIAVLTNRDNALRLRDEMERRFGAARLIERDGARPSWRVVVAEAESEAGAAGVLDQLRASYADAFVVRID